jgi:flap endonuclease-1
MGADLHGIAAGTDIELRDLAGKKIAIDAYNTLYQFLSIIRLRTGEPLQDSKGRITSHLSGLFYRTAKLLESGIKPVYVFDGKKPEFKTATTEARREAREEAAQKWEEALAAGREAEARKYAQAAVQLTDEMIFESQKLLNAMGIPIIQAPSEGEAQCAKLVLDGSAFAAGSQDYDTLLFGCPKLVRNISITGKRKVPGKEVWMEIKPEVLELRSILDNLNITREQLVIIGILSGTDYNPGGIKGIGPKKALELVRKYKSLDAILKKVEWSFDVQAADIYNFYLNPPVSSDYDIQFSSPKQEEIIRIMVDEHDFSLERVQKTIKVLAERRAQRTLDFFR